MAFVARAIPNRFSRQMHENIGICFPGLDQSAQEQLYRRALRHTIYVFTELAAVWRWPAAKILPRITTLDICEEFQQTDRGKIVLAPHLGSWEMLGIWLGQHCDAIILYKRLKDKALDEYIRQLRGRTGGTPVPTKKHGLRKLLIGLRANGTLMILPDQKPGVGQSSYQVGIFWCQCTNHDPGKKSMQQGRLRCIYCYYLPQFAAGRVRPDYPAARSRTPG